MYKPSRRTVGLTVVGAVATGVVAGSRPGSPPTLATEPPTTRTERYWETEHDDLTSATNPGGDIYLGIVDRASKSTTEAGTPWSNVRVQVQDARGVDATSTTIRFGYPGDASNQIDLACDPAETIDNATLINGQLTPGNKFVPDDDGVGVGTCPDAAFQLSPVGVLRRGDAVILKLGPTGTSIVFAGDDPTVPVEPSEAEIALNYAGNPLGDRKVDVLAAGEAGAIEARWNQMVARFDALAPEVSAPQSLSVVGQGLG